MSSLIVGWSHTLFAASSTRRSINSATSTLIHVTPCPQLVGTFASGPARHEIRGVSVTPHRHGD